MTRLSRYSRVVTALALLVGTAEAGPPFARSPSLSSKLQSFTKLMEQKKAANPPRPREHLRKKEEKDRTETPLAKMMPLAKTQPKREAPPAGAAKLQHFPPRKTPAKERRPKAEAKEARRARRAAASCDDTVDDVCLISLSGEDDFRVTVDSHWTCSNLCRKRGQVGGLAVPTSTTMLNAMHDLCDEDHEACYFGLVQAKVNRFGLWGGDNDDDWYWTVDQGRSVKRMNSDDFYADVDIEQFDVGDLDISQDDADWGLLYDGDEYQYWDFSVFEYLNGADADRSAIGAICGCRDTVPISPDSEEIKSIVDGSDCDDKVDDYCLVGLDYDDYGDNFPSGLLQCQSTCQARGWEGTIAAPMTKTLNNAIIDVCDDNDYTYCQIGVVHCNVNSNTGQWCKNADIAADDPWYFIKTATSSEEVDDFEDWGTCTSDDDGGNEYDCDDTTDFAVVTYEEDWFSFSPYPAYFYGEVYVPGFAEANGLDGDDIGMVCMCDMSTTDAGGRAGYEDDDDEAICFSGDSTVQLASGATKTMADLEVGDSILSADAAGKLSYSDVAFLPHGANAKAADFVKVTTESGNAVKATPTHLLVSCDGSLVQAKAAACLRTVNGDEAVTSIESFKANGIYSAVTLDNEFLVVDGVVASPFVMTHGLLDAFYNLHRMVYKNFPSLMKMPAVVSANSLLAAGALAAMNAVTVSEK